MSDGRQRSRSGLGRRARGFTLVELMIAVVILGILTAIAVPSYSRYVLRGNRTVAKSALTQLAGNQDGYFVVNKQYASNANVAKIGGNTYLYRDGTMSTSSTDAIYQITVASLPASPGGGSAANSNCNANSPASGTLMSYLLVATPVNNQLKDTSCGAICLTSTGIKLASAGSTADCWSR